METENTIPTPAPAAFPADVAAEILADESEPSYFPTRTEPLPPAGGPGTGDWSFGEDGKASTRLSPAAQAREHRAYATRANARLAARDALVAGDLVTVTGRGVGIIESCHGDVFTVAVESRNGGTYTTVCYGDDVEPL